MDHEHADHLGDRAPAPQVEKAKPSPEAALPSQIGNRAFASLIQRSTTSQGTGPLDPEIAESIKTEKGGGRPLDDATRADMEGHLGADLSDVRVHTGSSADQLNRSVRAEAFTTGNDVFFKSGKYSPETSDGRGLLAHELTHVVQQGTGQVTGGGVSHPDDAHEVEAKSVGDAVATAPPGVQRREDQDEEESLQLSVDREEMPDEEELLQGSLDRDALEQQEELEDSAS
jgi:hypothetical protein